MLGVLIYYRTWEVGVILLVLVAIRRAPWFANASATMLDLDQYSGMTAWVARQALPAWDGARVVMSPDEDEPEERAPMPVHVPVPSSGGSPDTRAIPPGDDTSRREQFLVIMADQRDERGGWLFSANQIHAAIGGHRATILAQVRDRRAATPQPVYRTDAGATAPASHPVTRDSHGPSA